MKKTKKQKPERKPTFRESLKKMLSPEEFARWELVRDQRKHKKGHEYSLVKCNNCGRETTTSEVKCVFCNENR